MYLCNTYVYQYPIHIYIYFGDIYSTCAYLFMSIVDINLQKIPVACTSFDKTLFYIISIIKYLCIFDTCDACARHLESLTELLSKRDEVNMLVHQSKTKDEVSALLQREYSNRINKICALPWRTGATEYLNVRVLVSQIGRK